MSHKRKLTLEERALKFVARREARQYDRLAEKPRYSYEQPATWEHDDKPWWSCGHRKHDSKNPYAKRWVMLCEPCEKCTRTASEAARYAKTILDRLKS